MHCHRHSHREAARRAGQRPPRLPLLLEPQAISLAEGVRRAPEAAKPDTGTVAVVSADPTPTDPAEAPRADSARVDLTSPRTKWTAELDPVHACGSGKPRLSGVSSFLLARRPGAPVICWSAGRARHRPQQGERASPPGAGIEVLASGTPGGSIQPWQPPRLESRQDSRERSQQLPLEKTARCSCCCPEPTAAATSTPRGQKWSSYTDASEQRHWSPVQSTLPQSCGQRYIKKAYQTRTYEGSHSQTPLNT